jgi:hypothetical protein
MCLLAIITCLPIAGSPLAEPATAFLGAPVLAQSQSSNGKAARSGSTNYRDIPLKEQPPPPPVKVEAPKPPLPLAVLGYRYVEVFAGFDRMDTIEDDGATFGAAISWPITDSFYVRGGLSRSTFDTTVVVPGQIRTASSTVDTVSLAGGYRHALSETNDLIGEVLLGFSNDQLDIDDVDSGSDSGFGFGARGGSRWIFDRRIEVEADLRFIDFEDQDAQLGVGLSGRFHASDLLSLGVSFVGLEESNSFAGGLRFSW